MAAEGVGYDQICAATLICRNKSSLATILANPIYRATILANPIYRGPALARASRARRAPERAVCSGA